QHLLDVWVQYVPRGADRDLVARRVVDQLAAFAPGLESLVMHAHVSLPEDLEARFGLTDGHLYGGEGRLGQSFFSRPFPGSVRYGSPIAQLSLSGSAAHPGGYSGRSGWNFAAQLLAT